MFRYKRGIPLDYDRQGYIFFVSRQYRSLGEEAQKIILDLCLEHGGECYQALFEFVTTDTTATELEMKYYVSKATLYRMVRKYYEGFPARL